MTQRSMDRCVYGITRRDRKRNTWVRGKTGVTDIIDKVKALKWKWAGHWDQKKDNCWTSLLLNWTPRNLRRLVYILIKGCKDNHTYISKSDNFRLKLSIANYY